jgi:hypothetical protein
MYCIVACFLDLPNLTKPENYRNHYMRLPTFLMLNEAQGSYTKLHEIESEGKVM